MPQAVKSLGELTKEERAQLSQKQLNAILKQAGVGRGFLPGGGMRATVTDLTECETYFEKLPNGKIPDGSQYEHILLRAVYFEAV